MKWTNEKISIAKSLYDRGAPSSEISETTGMSIRSTQLFIQKYSSDGTFATKKCGRKPSIDTDELKKALESMLSENSTLSIDDMSEQLPLNLKVGKSKISQTLKLMGWSKKRIRTIPNERNTARVIEERKSYVYSICNRPDEDLIFLDETGINLHVGPNFGWSPLNISPILHRPANKGQNTSLLMAINTSGIVCHKIINGPFNSESFNRFLDKDLIPKIGPQNIILMDNARIHHARLVQETLNNRRVNYAFLPPYSPQLNPIEEIFAMIKNQYRRIHPLPSNQREIIEGLEQIISVNKTRNFKQFFEKT